MYDVYGVICGTYREACYVAGCDTPEQLAYEDAATHRDYLVAQLDDVEVNGPQYFFNGANWGDTPF